MNDHTTDDLLPHISNMQRNFMLDALNATREKSSDITVIVEDKQFRAHKWVLEANCPYFGKMFQSEMKETITGKVVLPDMRASTMEAILDFFYLGDVSEIKSQEDMIAVLVASDRLFIENLFNYCSYSLGFLVSASNCLYFWQLAEQYKSEILLKAVLSYFTENFREVVTSPAFLECDSEQIKYICGFSKIEFRNLDWLLLALLDWVQYDLEARENAIQDLLACLDVKLVSNLCIQSLLEDSSMLMTSQGIETGLRSLARGKHSSKEKLDTELGIVHDLKLFDCKLLSKSTKIAFLFEQFHVESLDRTVCAPTKSTLPDYYLQHFDMSTMMWQPAVRLRSIQFVDGACSRGKYIYMVGSYLNLAYIVYDMETRLLEYKHCANNVSTSHATLCYFRGYLWLLGGKCSNGDTHGAVYVLSPSVKNIPKWHQTTSLTHSCFNPTVLLSENHLYVTYGNNKVVEYPDIECITNVEWYNGKYYLLSTTITIPTCLIGITTHFYLFDNVLRGFCSTEDEVVELTYREQKWKIQGFPKLPKAVIGANRKSVSLSQIPYIFMSTLENNFGLPNLVWAPDKAKWFKIPDPSGVCVNLHGGNIKCVWS